MMLNKKVLVLLGVLMTAQVCAQVSEDEVPADRAVDYTVVADDEFERQLREFDELIEDLNALSDAVDKSLARDRDGMQKGVSGERHSANETLLVLKEIERLLVALGDDLEMMSHPVSAQSDKPEPVALLWETEEQKVLYAIIAAEQRAWSAEAESLRLRVKYQEINKEDIPQEVEALKEKDNAIKEKISCLNHREIYECLRQKRFIVQ
mgnify:CR=1 FL=1